MAKNWIKIRLPVKLTFLYGDNNIVDLLHIKIRFEFGILCSRHGHVATTQLLELEATPIRRQKVVIQHQLIPCVVNCRPFGSLLVTLGLKIWRPARSIKVIKVTNIRSLYLHIKPDNFRVPQVQVRYFTGRRVNEE